MIYDILRFCDFVTASAEFGEGGFVIHIVLFLVADLVEF
jgi:hypothetical protein